MFHEMLRRNITNSGERAVVVGHFFATVNAVACGLQLFVLPRLISQRNLPLLLSSIPLIVFFFILIAYFQSSSSLTIMLAFGALKVLEYSVMTSAVEMMYMPFNEDVRYLGKELVKFFGGKLGKSGSSLTLSALNAHFQPGLYMQSFWAGILAVAWFGTMSSLSKYLISSRHPDAHKKDDDVGFLTSSLGASTASGGDDGEGDEIISTTTSESNLSNLSNSHNNNVFNDDELERIFEEDPLADISPPDAWAQLTIPLTATTISSSNDLNNLFLKRSVSFQPEPTIIPPSTSQANLSDISELSFHQSETSSSSFLQQPNYMVRIGSTHVSLDELGDDDDEEEEVDINEPSKQDAYHPIPPRIFRSSGFYW